MNNLIEKARQRDDEAFAALARRYQNMAFAHALSKLGDYQLAEDAVQETFIAVYHGLSDLGDHAAFPTWIRTIAERQCNRYLRRKSLYERPEILSETVPATFGDPALRTEEIEAASTVHQAVMGLPEGQREAVILYYLEDLSQKEVARLLGIPAATVNNRLHAARTKLKRSLIAMAGKEISARRLDAEFSARLGEIVKVRGPIVDVQMNAEQLPQVLDTLKVGGESHATVLSVAQELGGGLYRCIVTGDGSAVAGGEVIAIEKETAGDLDAEALAVLADGLRREPSARIIETGIKAIDLFCPLVAGGVAALFGIQGVGKAVLVGELIRRVASSPDSFTIMGLMRRVERALGQEMMVKDREFIGLTEKAGGVELVWLLSDLACNPEYAASTDDFDNVLYCSPEIAAQLIWPALDPLLCKSKAFNKVSADHRETALRCRALLAHSRELMVDSRFLGYLAHGAMKLAVQRHASFREARLAELGAGDRLAVQRARKIENFMAQTFIVGEPYTGRSGTTVPLAETISVCKGILDGEYDDLPEKVFLFVGGLEDIRAKVKSL